MKKARFFFRIHLKKFKLLRHPDKLPDLGIFHATQNMIPSAYICTLYFSTVCFAK